MCSSKLTSLREENPSSEEIGRGLEPKPAQPLVPVCTVKEMFYPFAEEFYLECEINCKLGWEISMECPSLFSRRRGCCGPLNAAVQLLYFP